MAVSRRATSPAALRLLRRAELPPNADSQTKTPATKNIPCSMINTTVW